MARKPANTLMGLLDEARVSYELIPHRRTETAVAEAEALGIRTSEVAKTLVLTTPEGFVRVVLPASKRLDLREARRVLHTKDARLATEEVLADEYPEFDLGAVPPFGGAHRDRVLVDASFLRVESVVVEAGTHEQSLRIKTSDLLTLAEPEIADLCRDS